MDSAQFHSSKPATKPINWNDELSSDSPASVPGRYCHPPGDVNAEDGRKIHNNNNKKERRRRK